MIRSDFIDGYAEKATEKLRDDGLCSNEKDKIQAVISEHMMRLLLDIGSIE